jgi:uncharacterized cupin superfamily protein
MSIIIRQAADIPTAQLDKLGPVEAPLSWPPAELNGKKYHVGKPGARMMGVWECSPGRWRRTIMEEEFAHFIEGGARFLPDDGEPVDIKAGDTIWFPPNTRGVWEISQNVRKVYIILYKRSVLAVVRSWLATAFATLGLWMDIRPRIHSASGVPAPARDAASESDSRRVA